MQIQAQDDGYSLRLSSKELRIVVLCLLVLPDRYTDDAVEDLIGCGKQELSDLQTRIADEKYVVDQASIRQRLTDEGLISDRSDEDVVLPVKSSDELARELLEAARARSTAIEQNDVRGDILAQAKISSLLDHISARGGGPSLLSDLLVHGDAAVGFAIADQWPDAQPAIAIRVLERLSRDVSTPLRAFAAGVKYRQRRSSAGGGINSTS